MASTNYYSQSKQDKSTVAQVAKLDSPIDVMYLMHKALRAQADRTVALAARQTRGAGG